MPESSSSESTAEYSERDGSSLGRILLPITLVIAILAAALSGWLLYRHMQEGPQNAPNYTAAQRADAKQKICSTMDLVRKGVSLNTNLQPPGGPEDVTGTLAVAANARVSLFDGGQYLLAGDATRARRSREEFRQPLDGHRCGGHVGRAEL
jgi:hypothetical protein